MTKERLQKYRENEATTVLTRLRVKAVVKYICNQIESAAVRTHERKHVFKIQEIGNIEHTSNFGIYNNNITGYNNPTGQWTHMFPIARLPILEPVLEDLRTLLPDSKITVDPLETYILIDWS